MQATRHFCSRVSLAHSSLLASKSSRTSFQYECQRAYSRQRPRSVRIFRGSYGVNRVYLAIAATTIGLSAYLLRDDIRYWTRASIRTGRVLKVLLLNVRDYQKTLKVEHDDPIEGANFLKACHQRCAERTLHTIEANGSIFVKLGQHLSSMGYLLPAEWVTTFVPLQDKCPVSSFQSIQEMYKHDTGRNITDDFSEFSQLPLGAASLAQVHTAVLKENGQRVACKVQHPTLDDWAPLDMALSSLTFKTVKRFFPDYDLSWLSDVMEESLPQELDFRNEGVNAIRAREYFGTRTKFPLVIPNVISAHRRILVMDQVSGHRIDDLDYLDSCRISRDEVSATLARIFNTMIFAEDAPLHCDPHGGNIAIRHNSKRRYPYNFDLILYDHGLYRMPEMQLRRDYARLWLAVINADEPNMRLYAHKVANITEDQFPLFASAITGRDYRVLLRKEVTTSMRDSKEKAAISEVFGEDLLDQLIHLLGDVPSIVLMILKTNDLTRSLDEGLKTSAGPIRSFLILAKYASRTVWEDNRARILSQGSLLVPKNFWQYFKAWSAFASVEIKLFAYERYLSLRRHLHLG